MEKSVSTAMASRYRYLRQYQVNIYGFTKLEPAAIPSFSYGKSKLEAS